MRRVGGDDSFSIVFRPRADLGRRGEINLSSWVESGWFLMEAGGGRRSLAAPPPSGLTLPAPGPEALLTFIPSGAEVKMTFPWNLHSELCLVAFVTAP